MVFWPSRIAARQLTSGTHCEGVVSGLRTPHFECGALVERITLVVNFFEELRERVGGG